MTEKTGQPALQDLDTDADPEGGMNKIGMTPQIRIHTQQTTDVRKTVDTSFGAKLQQGLSATS